MKIGIIGIGKMGEAMLRGILKSKKSGDIYIFDIDEQRLENIQKETHVNACSVEDVVKNCDIIILAVKPQDFLSLNHRNPTTPDYHPESALPKGLGRISRMPEKDNSYNWRGTLQSTSFRTELSFSEHIESNKLFISIMAGIKIDTLKNSLKSNKIIRVMPNICSLVHESCSAYACSSEVNEEEENEAQELLENIGDVVKVEEKLIDAVTGLSGSGPAYVAFFIECLANAGIKQGLDSETANKMALQTVFGTARLLKQKKILPAELVKMVSSKKGTTEKGMEKIKNSDFEEILAKAVEKAAQRSRELGK